MNTTEEPGKPVEVGDPVEQPDDAETRGEPDVEPTAEPDDDPADTHRGPLDDDEDARHLDRDDVRRQDAERRRGKPFDQDEPETDDQQDEGETEQTPDDS
jgi:hypothetical protein